MRLLLELRALPFLDEQQGVVDVHDRQELSEAAISTPTISRGVSPLVGDSADFLC